MNEKRSQSLNSFTCSHKKYRSLIVSLCVIFVVKICNGMRMTRRAHKGQSIKYVTLFLANFDPLLNQKPSVQILSQLFARFFQGVFCLEGFVRGGFCPFPFCPNTSVTTES